MVKYAVRSCHIGLLVCIVLMEIHLGEFALVDDHYKLLSKQMNLVTKLKSHGIWMKEGKWCAMDEHGRTVCSRKNDLSGPIQEQCSKINLRNSFYDDNGFHCICVGPWKLCTVMGRNEDVKTENENVVVSVDSVIGMCSPGSMWFNGNQWCVCMVEPNLDINETVYCSSGLLDDGTLYNNRCILESERLWRTEHAVCACSTNDQSVCVSTSPNDKIDQNREENSGNPNMRFPGLKRHRRSPQSIIRGHFDYPRQGFPDVSCGGRPVGARWLENCNMCICTNSRVALCTGKYCVSMYRTRTVPG